MFEESNIREVLRKYTNQQKDLNSDYGKWKIREEMVLSNEVNIPMVQF